MQMKSVKNYELNVAIRRYLHVRAHTIHMHHTAKETTNLAIIHNLVCRDTINFVLVCYNVKEV